MTYDHHKHHRRSIRIRGYDYSQSGAYFVTICAQNRECLFGNIVDGEMRLNDSGQMVHSIWNDLPDRYPDIETDEFVVMPNHVHGIVVIRRDDCRGEVFSPPVVSPIPIIKQGGGIPPLRRHTLGQIIAFFKYQTTKQINKIRDTPRHPVWQRNYYEHIIRGEQEMNRIREYIIANPAKWTEDENNPENILCRGVIHRASTNIL